MPLILLDDLDDSRLAAYRHLKRSNETRWAGEFVVEGPKLVDRLARSRFPLRSVLATDREAESVAATLPGDVPVYVVRGDRLSDLVGFRFHQGVLGCGARVPWPGWDAWLVERPASLRLVVCPELHNPENLGAILRLADVFGLDAVITGNACPDPLSRRVLRVSMGCALDIPVHRSDDLAGLIGRLADALALRRFAAVVAADAEPFDRIAIPDRFALVLGAEGPGLSPEWVARCDHRITIPMRAGAESLNVAVAAGILLYRFAGGPGPESERLDKTARL